MDELINGFFVLQVSIRAVPTEFYRKQKKKHNIVKNIYNTALDRKGTDGGN